MARVQHGLPGIYNSSALSLSSGDGAAVGLDSSGYTVISSSLGAGAVAASGKTLLTKTGSASATFTLVAAPAANRIKVVSLDLITAATTAVTVTFKDGASGTAIATYPLQAITGTNFGITKSVPVPSFLFATTAATLLEMAFSAAQTVTYNITYHVDDLT